MKQTHSLLKRQLKRYFGGQNFMPKEWQGFIEAVNNAYWQSDNDRNMLERSLELMLSRTSSGEFGTAGDFSGIPGSVLSTRQ